MGFLWDKWIIFSKVFDDFNMLGFPLEGTQVFIFWDLPFTKSFFYYYQTQQFIKGLDSITDIKGYIFYQIPK